MINSDSEVLPRDILDDEDGLFDASVLVENPDSLLGQAQPNWVFYDGGGKRVHCARIGDEHVHKECGQDHQGDGIPVVGVIRPFGASGKTVDSR